jgi:DNA-binding LacI/PurR family transcriptional regulator
VLSSSSLGLLDKHLWICYYVIVPDIDNGTHSKRIFPVMNFHSKRPTIKQVAKVAGVSMQTVSRVINDRPDVSPETRERIQQVIDELGYQPSALARSLIQRRSYTLGVVTAGLKYIGPSRTLNGITTKAEELGYALLLKELPNFTIHNIQSLIQFLFARHIDGILWAVPEIGDNRNWVETGLENIPVPTVFLTMQSRPGIPVVSVDNLLGGRLATQHLLEQGCQHIGHISGPLEWWEARQRKQGWQEALQAAGRRVTEAHCAEGNWSASSGEIAFQQLLQSYPEMDAAFIANDQMALGALQLANRRGLRIPQDLAVVGFDNIAEAAHFYPSLTTVNQNQHELGCQGVQELVTLIEAVHASNQAIEPKSRILVPELVVRDSSVAR